ncbi:hypothetical protein M0R45_001884 [Rubus argutus]|uniref:Uncharacterized protein n=1 Tax=Rubus argutus TaxID=59490 RepID=A0AAW1VFA1_RUBAR
MSRTRANFRRYINVDDDTNDNAKKCQNPSMTATVKSLPKPSSSSAKPKKLLNQASKVLNFVDDEENKTPSRSSSSKSNKSLSSRLGKPSSTHKMTTLKGHITNSSTVSTSLPSNVQPQARMYLHQRSALILKPAGSKISKAVNGARDLDSKDEEWEKETSGSFRRDKDDFESRSAFMGIDKDRLKYLDQAIIETIQKKRERLWKSRPAV